MRLLFLLFFSLQFLAHAQSLPALQLAGTTYVSLSDLARQLGYSVTEGSQSLTVRTEAGVLVVFADSPDILWRSSNSAEPLERSDFSLSAPVRLEAGGWFAPEDLFRQIGFELKADALVTPTQTFRLRFPPLRQAAVERHSEVRALGSGVNGLNLYASGSAGAETLSLLLVDAGLMSLVLPNERQILDGLMGQFSDKRPLYVVLTSLAASPWETSLNFSQQGQHFEARPPHGLSILSGETGQVSPETPVTALVLLPLSFDLRKPIQVSWAGVDASMTFRR